VFLCVLLVCGQFVCFVVSVCIFWIFWCIFFDPQQCSFVIIYTNSKLCVLVYNSTVFMARRYGIYKMSFSLLLKYRRAVDCGRHRHSLLWCQQHVVQHLGTEPLRLLDHVRGTVYLSSSLTARHFSPEDLFIYLVYLFRTRIDCVKRPCCSLGLLRRCNFVKLHVTLH